MKQGVVVTGASTGIGRAVAVRLAATGWRVFGTVRKPADEAALEAAGVQPVQMDVTDPQAIAGARNQVLDALGGAPLAGLVNNAGVAAAGPLEHLPLGDLRHVLEVNVIGVVAVTQAFLPALRRSRGRVINIGSVSGRVAMPFAGPYAATKFALEAISDSLRRELIPSGVQVVLVQPGSIATPIWEKVARLDLDQYHGTAYAAVLPRVLERTLSSGRRGLPPDTVATAVLEALTARRPPIRIVVAPRPWRTRLARWLPDRWLDRGVAKQLWGRS